MIAYKITLNPIVVTHSGVVAGLESALYLREFVAVDVVEHFAT